MCQHSTLGLLIVVWFVFCTQAFVPTRCIKQRFGKNFIANKERVSIVTGTDTTIIVPRYLEGEIPEGSYPSPLHSIHIVSLLTDRECETCLMLAKEHAAKTKCWEKPDFSRHSSYATCDFPINENDNLLAEYLNEINFNARMWELLSDRYGIATDDMTYLDHFCAHYCARSVQNGDYYHDSDDTTMDRLEAHRDGSILSFTVLLTPPCKFTGGGTFFDALADIDIEHENIEFCKKSGAIRPLRAGDACLHSGKLLHGADVVTSGERTLLVGFVDVDNKWQRSGVLSEACKQWGRMDVATHRYRRQQLKCNDGHHCGWFLGNHRWLPQGPNRSHIRGFCPAFFTVERRASKIYQRRKKLEAEDQYLRSILLSNEEMSASGILNGDITIL